MLFAGIDVGSQSTDVVIINELREIISYCIIPTGAVHKNAIEKSVKEACMRAQCKFEDISYIVSTGYGRKNVEIASKNVTEITCHAKGAFFLNPQTRTILDIGGQDSKVIKLNDDGSVMNFSMNEKCAAGTGRFLETMARVLDISLDKMGEESLKSTELVKLSSICTVFAESEVISQIAAGKKRVDIIRGIHDSICDRSIAMLEKINYAPSLTMTGGVAKNIGVVDILSKRLDTNVFVPDEPQIAGSLGAALIAFEKYSKMRR